MWFNIGECRVELMTWFTNSKIKLWERRNRLSDQNCPTFYCLWALKLSRRSFVMLINPIRSFELLMKHFLFTLASSNVSRCSSRAHHFHYLNHRFVFDDCHEPSMKLFLGGINFQMRQIIMSCSHAIELKWSHYVLACYCRCCPITVIIIKWKLHFTSVRTLISF